MLERFGRPETNLGNPQLIDLIRYKRESLKNTYKSKQSVKLPEVEIPDFLGDFFQNPKLWTNVDGTYFVHSGIVKEMIVRKDGSPKSAKLFSVFIADQKRKIESQWSVKPLAATNKQRNQFWNQEFVAALFTNILFCEQNKSVFKSKIAYTLDPNFSINNLIEIHEQKMKHLFG